MSDMTLTHLSALPADLMFAEGETPTREKVRAMLAAMQEAGYSQRGLMIEEELRGMGLWFAQQWADHGEPVPHDPAQALLEMFARDMLPALGDNWQTYDRPLSDVWVEAPASKLHAAAHPEYARAYMLDTAKSAADLLLRWLILGRVAFREDAQ